MIEKSRDYFSIALEGKYVMRNINPNSVIASSIVDITFFFWFNCLKIFSILIKKK